MSAGFHGGATTSSLITSCAVSRRNFFRAKKMMFPRPALPGNARLAILVVKSIKELRVARIFKGGMNYG